MLTILLGTDWTVNSSEVLRRIAADVKEEKPGRILMVPELISHETERRLCAIAGDTSSRFAEVVSFTRLARRVSEFTGQGLEPCLDNGGRVVAMASAARMLHSKLKAYASVETNPEFLTGLVDAVDEFKRCCITPEDLRQASLKTEGSLAQKLEELSLLLEGYDALCQQGKRDPRDQMTWLLEELESSDFGSSHVFYVDGFPDFTRQHMAILEHLIVTSSQVLISLNCDVVDSSAMAFEKAGSTAGHLVRFAKRMGIAVEIVTMQPRQDALLPMRQKLFQGNIRDKLPENSLKLFRTQSVYQECMNAAAQIQTLVQSGSRYREIIVVCSDIEAYRNTISMVFQRCNIPIYLSGTEQVLEKSVIMAVLTALDTALHNFEQQDVLDYLKSPICPVSMEMADKLENYGILWSVSGKQWLEDWKNHPEGLGEKWHSHTQEQLDRLNDARRQVIEPLEALRSGFRNATSLGQQVQSLYAFLANISLAERLDKLAKRMDGLSDNRSAQILNQLWDILVAALEQLYDVLGDTAWEADTFCRLFKLLLSQYDIGTIPPVLDAVSVGPVSAMRCSKAKHLFILGAAEGSLPGYGGSTGVLSDQERTQLRSLGVPLTGGAMEGLQAEFAEIYGVFCGASDSVCVSCPGAEPSFVYNRLKAMSYGESEAQWDIALAMSDKLEAGAYLLRMHQDDLAEQLNIADAVMAVGAGVNYSLGNIKQENVDALYGDMLTLSASQIDRQAQCRLSYFLRYGLRLKERKAASVDPAEFGTYVHAVMEHTVAQVMEEGGFGQVSLERMLEIANLHSSDYAKERFAQLDAQRLQYLFQRNTKELEMIVRELWQEMQNSQFAPVGFELGFGPDGPMPPVEIHGTSMDARLLGFVDRVDVWKNDEESFFRVVDYKTGKKDFDYCDVINGLGLQMLLYMFALEQEGADIVGEASVPAGVQYFPARAPLVSADSLLSDEEAALAREKLWKRKGLVLSEEQVLEAMEGLDAPIRTGYTKKKDGSLSGDIASRGQFKLLKAYVFALLGKMVDDIASGNVQPNPYTRGTAHNACTFCPYKSVCHSDSVEARRNYKTITAQRFWEEIAKEVPGNG